ncbi:hypothetical protein HC031_11645 [Planosporangium thailandense]|uniref:Uncharacterized protein n=1 Tax=Planosporangium thailandense TaxID=765197 RepID=A0ABX0XYN4_9ACTN|nr:hypothetical protein [Planosporangium thailandense]
MRVCVRVEDDSGDDSRSLLAWLREEPRVRRYGEPAVADGDGDPVHMGGGVEVLNVVLGAGLSAAQLALSIIMWRASRGRPVRVIIEHDDGQVPVDTDDPDDAETIAAKIESS